MDYRPNVDAVCWLVRDCWPRIHEVSQRPFLTSSVVCPRDGSASCLPFLGIDVVGAVADGTSQVLRFAVRVAPMRIARGLQDKFLEAMGSRSFRGGAPIRLYG